MIFLESNEKAYFPFYRRIAEIIKPKIYVGVLGGGTQHYYFVKYSKIAILVDINIEQINYIKDYRDKSCTYISNRYSKYPISSDYIYQLCLSKGKILREVSFSELLNSNIFYLPIRKADLIYLSNVTDYILDKYYREGLAAEGIDIMVKNLENLLENSKCILFLNLFEHLWELYVGIVQRLERKFKVRKYLSAYVVGKTGCSLESL